MAKGYGLVATVATLSLLVSSVVSWPFSPAMNAEATSNALKVVNLDPALTVTVNSGTAPATDNFNITQGFNIEPVLWNLTLPSAVTFDEKGNIYVAEAGYAPGGLEAFPRILKIDSNGTITTLTDRVVYPPITDIQYHDGKIYVSNRGKISIVDAVSGKTTDLIMGLRNLGDYRTNQIAIGPEGRLYFGQGAATNSGVIGEDNYEWLRIMPTYYGIPPFHDVPGQNVTLAGRNFESADVYTPIDKSDSTATGAFVPFGNLTQAGQKINGGKLCTACIISAKADGTDLRVEAWGLKDPYGLAYDKNSNKFLVSANGADERGSRPIANDTDKLYLVDAVSNATDAVKFYGWPDFFGNAEPVTSDKFQSDLVSEQLDFLIEDHPPVEKPLAQIGKDVTLTQIALSNNSNFGYKGKAFIGEFGSIGYSVFGSIGVPSPDSTGENSWLKIGSENKTAGQKLIVVDPESGNHTDFLSLKDLDPNFRPVGLEFTNDGSSLYVVSVGKVEIRNETSQGHPMPAAMPWYHKNTGVLWRITNSSIVDQGLAGQGQLKPDEIHLSQEIKESQINEGEPPTDPSTLRIHGGYKIEPILWNLDKPGSFAFDDRNNMYIASTGVTYGKQTTTATIYKIEENGRVSVFLDRPLHGILSDIEFNKDNGLLYIAHRNVVSTVDPTTGVVTDLVNGLPTSAYVTHPMGQLAFGPENRLYFNVGGLSNLAVPDISDYGIGWIAEMPFMHEVPAVDIRLNGINFQSDNFLTADPDDKVITGSFMPFGVPAYEDQLVRGDIKCTSCVYSIKPDGTDMKVHAWGARSVYGMAFDEEGRLHWTNNGNDDKGIRRVTSDVDTVSVVDVRNNGNISFYGWPDFMGMGEPITAQKFNQSPVQHYPNVPLIKDPPPVIAPLVDLGAAVAATQLAFSTSDEFGFKDKMFLGEFGTSAPVQHVFHEPSERSPGEVMGRLIGQKVVIYDPDTGTIRNFLEPAVADGSFRPVGLGFGPDGNALYLTSIEIHQIRKVTPSGAILSSHAEYPFAMSGVVWKITHENATIGGS